VQQRLSHPLCGADPMTLWTIRRQAGPVAPFARRAWLIAWAAAVARTPSLLAEALYVERRRAEVSDASAPLFILGHWRSGTTHLYNLLAQSPQMAFVSPFATALPWDFLLLGRALEPLLARALPEHRYIDKIQVDPDSPQEDEIALANMTALSYYHALYFPGAFEPLFRRGVFFDGVSDQAVADWQRLLRGFYDKLALRQPGRQLVIKNPAYTARPLMLYRMWPQARFIHIHRHPVKVFLSMRNFFTKLFEQFALQPWDHLDIDEIIFATYERMMDQLIAQSADIPPQQFLQIRYETFQGGELAGLRQIYEHLRLPDFDQDAPIFQAYLQRIAGYQKNRFQVDPALVRRIETRWSRFFDYWEYQAAA